LILAVEGGTIAEVSTALRDLLLRHVDAGTIPGGVALMGAGNVEVVAAGVAWVGGGAMGEDAIMRIQSMTKAITSVCRSWLAVRCCAVRRLSSTTPCRLAGRSPFATC
jgi:hypothetical protein